MGQSLTIPCKTSIAICIILQQRYIGYHTIYESPGAYQSAMTLIGTNIRRIDANLIGFAQTVFVSNAVVNSFVGTPRNVVLHSPVDQVPPAPVQAADVV